MDNETLELTAEIVSAYVSNNSLPATQLQDLIASVSAALSSLRGFKPEVDPKVNLVPAVAIKKSVTADYIVCLEDGKKFKSLKRHLGVLRISPEEYRTKWNLPRDYPMVAPNYAATRSALAKSMGLGRTSRVINKAKKKKKAA